jgi:hypothetical protein
MTDEIANVDDISTIPHFMEALRQTYSIEVPIDLEANHSLYNLWSKTIQVTTGTSPQPRYRATGEISSEFPFNFAAGLTPNPEDFTFLGDTKPDIHLSVKLAIDVFRPAPPSLNARGIKVTVRHVPKTPENPNGVIRDDGLDPNRPPIGSSQS